jgi:hypothetical protein
MCLSIGITEAFSLFYCKRRDYQLSFYPTLGWVSRIFHLFQDEPVRCYGGASKASVTAGHDPLYVFRAQLAQAPVFRS